MHNLDDQHFVSPQVVNILVIHWLPGKELWWIGSFTAIIPCHPVNNYNITDNRIFIYQRLWGRDRSININF